MALLLDQRGSEITITDKVVKAAAGNWKSGKEVMALLLNQRGSEITITDEVVKAAAGNGGSGKEVMALLLDQRGSEITITDEVVRAAAGNEKNGHKIMALLFKQRAEETAASISERVLFAAATCGQDMVLDLLSRENPLVPIDGEHRSIAKFYNAAKAGQTCHIERLLHEGIKPDFKNIRGVTPLCIAAALGRDAVVSILARRPDVDVNSTSMSGQSPLFWSSYFGHEQVVAALLEAGADANLMDENGDTAFTMARKNRRWEVLKMLPNS